MQVNRPADLPCCIQRVDGGCEPVNFCAPTVPLGFANKLEMDTDPEQCIEVYHLHCHFYNEQLQPQAAALLLGTMQALEEGENFRNVMLLSQNEVSGRASGVGATITAVYKQRQQ